MGDIRDDGNIGNDSRQKQDSGAADQIATGGGESRLAIARCHAARDRRHT